MTISERITQARHDRNARAAARAELKKLAQELATYSTASDRLEIELIAARSSSRDAEIVLDILDQIRVTDASITALRSV